MGLSKKSKMNIGLALGALGVAGVSALLAYGVRKVDPRFYRTKFGPAVVCTMTGPDGRAVRLLLVGRSVQSATYVDEEYRAEPVFDYYLAFDLMFDAKPDIARVLMVGGGGYAYPKHIIATRPEVHMDVVEIDPAITRIALTDFYLAEYLSDFPFGGTYDLGRICADGCDYLADLSRVVQEELGGEGCGIGRAERVTADAACRTADNRGPSGIANEVDGAECEVSDAACQTDHAEGEAGDAERTVTGGACGVVGTECEVGDAACQTDHAEHVPGDVACDSEFARQARRRYGASFGQRYDAMVFDVFAGKKPVASLASPVTIRNAHTCLNPGGVLIANVVSTLEGPKSAFLHQYVEALEGEFAHVHVIPLSPDSTDAPDNVILLATDATWEFAGI